MSTRPRGLSTLCVHAGDQRDPQGATFTPLYPHSTFAFEDTASLVEVVAGKKAGGFYSRYGSNPTLLAAEARVAAIEGGESALLFGSGMAAISATLLATCAGGGSILCAGDIYGGTWELLTGRLPGLGVPTTFQFEAEPTALAAALRPDTRVLYLESPTNPGLGIHDIAALAAFARQHGLLTIVDNTFASPIVQNPLALGADLVLHSATKYLGGHSDLTGGAVIGSSERMARIWPWRKDLGSVMAPDVAFLLSRSLRTLAVRVREQGRTAATLAARLDGHPHVERVLYPGLASHPGHALAARQMRGFGAMLSIAVRSEPDRQAQTAAAVVDRLRLFAIAASLGGVESLATQPITTTHRTMDPAERARRGISDNMIRLSIGLEDVEDLWEDLDQALRG